MNREGRNGVGRKGKGIERKGKGKEGRREGSGVREKERGREGEREEFQTPAGAIGHHAKTFFIQMYVLQIIIYSFLENFKLISVDFRSFR